MVQKALLRNPEVVLESKYLNQHQQLVATSSDDDKDDEDDDDDNNDDDDNDDEDDDDDNNDDDEDNDSDDIDNDTDVLFFLFFVCLFFSGAAYLISSLSIDLSKYALEICKNTIGKLLQDSQTCKV